MKRLLKHIDGDLYQKDVLITNEKGPLHDEYDRYSDNLWYSQEILEGRDIYATIFKKIQEHKYDIVHFFNLWIIYDIILRIKRTYPKVEIMTTICVDLYFHRNSFAKDIEVMKKIQPVLRASITDAEINRQILPNITVIRNGVDPNLFKPAEKKPKTVAWVSRLHRLKNAHRIPQIARLLPDYRFIMVGDKETEVYQEIVKDQPPNLEIKIELSEEEVAKEMSTSKYFLFTSISEAMPLTIMEAMASECCVISEQVGDISSVLKDGVNGHFIPEDVDLVEWVAENLPKLDTSVAKEGRSTILNGFTIDQSVKQYEFLYNTIGKHDGQPRLAFLWYAPKYEKYWDVKIDALQNTIAKLSHDNVVQIFTTSETTYKPIDNGKTMGFRDFKANKKNAFKKIINGQNIFFNNHKDYRELIIELRRFKPDMIFMNVFHKDIWKRVIKAFPDTWKSIKHFGSPNLTQWGAKDLDSLIVQQEYLRVGVVDHNKVSIDKVVVAPYGIETDIFKPMDVEKEYTGVMLADFREKVKRQHLLIDAWTDIPGRLLLIGRYERSLPSGYHESCMEQAEYLGIRDRIDFMDDIPHSEIPALLNKAKIALLTSAWEGGSLALMEMMACGLPALVLSDCHGNTNRIVPGVDGLVARPTPACIAETTLRLLDDYERMGVNASKRIRWEFHYDSTYEVYRELVEKWREGNVRSISDNDI